MVAILEAMPLYKLLLSIISKYKGHCSKEDKLMWNQWEVISVTK